MKKLLMILLCCVLMAGCGNNRENEESKAQAEFKADVQEHIDVQMATYMFEVRRQNELLEELIDLAGDIRDKTGITEGEIFNATRKGVKSFQNRTKKNPWPVLA